MCLVGVCHPNLVFVPSERPDFHTPLRQTNGQTLTTSKQNIWIYLQLISSPITLWTEVNLRTWINRRWEWIILSGRSLTVFEENIVVTVLAKLVSLFFKNVHTLFLFSYALSNWQVIDCERYLCNNVSKFVWKPFKSPFRWSVSL